MMTYPTTSDIVVCLGHSVLHDLRAIAERDSLNGVRDGVELTTVERRRTEHAGYISDTQPANICIV